MQLLLRKAVIIATAMLLGLSSSLAATTPHHAKWTVMLDIQAKNNLAPFAEQNLRDIANAGSSTNVNIVAQWERPHEHEAWRYEISYKQVIAKMSVSTMPDPATKMIDFAKWTFENYPADHYCLILWNHGTGVIDPPFGSPLRVFLANKAFTENPRIDLEGIFEKVLVPVNQAVLINEESKTFLSNADLSRALKTITSPAMLGRKIDCIGFDACFMGMIEVAYEIRNYARYMIASEELELARGWNYEMFIPRLIATLPTPEQLARTIVTTYGDYYKHRTSFCTQAAIDLSKLDALKKCLDETVKQLTTAYNLRPGLQITLQNARNVSQQFSARVYVDLHSFCSSLLFSLTNTTPTQATTPTNPHIRKNTHAKNAMPQNLTPLVQSLTTTVNAIESTIIESTHSPQLAGARGLSIYFPVPPTKNIDYSYDRSAFSRESLWKSLLGNMLNN